MLKSEDEVICIISMWIVLASLIHASQNKSVKVVHEIVHAQLSMPGLFLILSCRKYNIGNTVVALPNSAWLIDTNYVVLKLFYSNTNNLLVYWKFVQYRSMCMALPGVKFLSNPRRMHSREEGEEKEEQELPRAPSCCSTTLPAPSPPPSHTPRAYWAAWDPLSWHRPPPPLPHCKQANF